jgi:hypothetical protein
MSPFYVINGRYYDGLMMGMADRMVRESADNYISELDIQEIYQLMGGAKGRFSNLQHRTLDLIGQRYKLTTKAKEWLAAHPPAGLSPAATIERMIQRQLNMPAVVSAIDLEEMTRQMALPHAVDFEEALAKALLLWEYPPRYHGEIVLHQIFDEGLIANGSALVSVGLQSLPEVTIHLAPLSGERISDGIVLHPAYGNVQDYWVFALQSEESLVLYAYVHRHDPDHYYGHSRIWQEWTLADRLKVIAEDLLSADDMNIQIDEAEAMRQMDAYGSFFDVETVFYSALYRGLLGGEGRNTFRQTILLENRVNVSAIDNSLSELVFRYHRTARIRLVSEAGPPAGADWVLPHWFEGDFAKYWYFVIDFPQLTHYRFVVSVSREVFRGKVITHSDRFTVGTLGNAGQQIEQVLRQEYNLDNLDNAIDLVEFERQMRRYDPPWREPATVIRQLMSVLLNDTDTEGSFLSVMVQDRPELLMEAAENEDNIIESLSVRARELLNESRLLLLPTEIVTGETEPSGEYRNPHWGLGIENTYVFQLIVPGLGEDAIFFICILRDPMPYEPSINYLAGSNIEGEEDGSGFFFDSDLFGDDDEDFDDYFEEGDEEEDN